MDVDSPNIHKINIFISLFTFFTKMCPKPKVTLVFDIIDWSDEKIMKSAFLSEYNIECYDCQYP